MFGLYWKWQIRITIDSWTQTCKVQKTPKVPLLLKVSKLQIKVHLVDMVKISYLNHWTYPMSGGRAELHLCLPDVTCPPSSGAVSSSSVLAQSKSLSSPPDQLVTAQLAQTPQMWTVGIAVQLLYTAIALQCNFLPPEIGRRTKKTLDSINIATKYCSSQRGITFCLRCIELDLAR